MLIAKVSRSVEPLVMRIKGGDGDVEDFHAADRAVAAARFDKNCGEGLHGKTFAVEFDEAFAVHFEHGVNLRHFLVIVRARIELDVDDVDGGDGVVGRGKTPTRPAARAAHGRHLVELADHELFRGGGGGGGAHVLKGSSE